MSQVPTPGASRFEFVVTAGARAKQLLKGASPRVDRSGKAAQTAMREVSAGVVQRVAPDAGDTGQQD